MTAFTYRPCGTTGHEILDPAGQVIGWTVDVGWACLIVGLLNHPGPYRPGQAKETTMTKQEIKNLVNALLKARPDLVIVKTDNQREKVTLVKLLKAAGAKVIYREGR